MRTSSEGDNAEPLLTNLGNDPLGSDVQVPGFDPDGDFSEKEQVEREQAIDEWARKGGEGSDESPLGDKWNTLPFGKPGDCRDKLFVHVADSCSIDPLLQSTSRHLQLCPQTAYVVFHIGGSIGYLEWLTALNQFRGGMSQTTPSKVTFATRIAHSWLPRPNQRPSFWKGAMTLGATDNGRPIDVAHLQGAGAWNKLKHRIWLVEELGLLTLRFGYILEHTHQPPPITQGPDVSFGKNCRTTNGAIFGWKVRVYFRVNTSQHLSLGFPDELMRQGMGNSVVRGAKENWSPTDQDKFLKNPYLWLDKGKLPLSRP